MYYDYFWLGLVTEWISAIAVAKCGRNFPYQLEAPMNLLAASG
jgi:hypothetical protein